MRKFLGRPNIFWISFPTTLGLLGLFLYSCIGRSLNVDDAWLGDPAFWFAKEGVLRSEALRGWEKAEVQLFFTHKLWVLTGGYFVRFFGYGVTQLKMISLLYWSALLMSWYFIMARLNLNKKVFWIFLILFLSNSFLFEYGFVFRPDVAMAFYCSWVFYLNDCYLKTNRYNYLVGAGLCAAVALGHHLNGVIVIGAGGLLLLLNRRIPSALVFGILASLGFAIHLSDVRSQADLNQFLGQLFHGQDLRGDRSFFRYLFNILDEQRRYLHSLKEASLTLLLISALYVGWKSLVRDYKNMLTFTFALMALLAIIAHGKTSKYLLLMIPFFLFFISVIVAENFSQNKKKFAALLGLYFICQIPTNWHFTFNKSSITPLLEELTADLPHHHNVLGPMTGVFWAWDKHRYQALEVYEIFELRKVITWDRDVLLKMLAENQIDTIIFNETMKNNFGAGEATYGPYHLTKTVLEGDRKLYLYVKSH